MRPNLAALAFSLALCAPALAGPSADLATAALEGRGPAFEQAAQALRAAPAGDREARFGEGLVLFARAVERYGQAQHRHGLRAPPAGAGFLPFLRMPVPVNPSPEPLGYEAQRKTLAAFLDDLGKAKAALAKVEGDPKIRFDMNAVALDFTGDPSRRVRLGDLVAQMQSGGRAMRPGAPPPAGPQDWRVAFDRGDALWLQGYCNLLSAGLEFALAHDWSESFGILGRQFYPRAEAPAIPFVTARDGRGMTGADGDIVDLVAFVHSIRWPVVEPKRMSAARERLLETIALSRASWKAILAETDDEREWVPSPDQKDAAVTFAPVTQQTVEGWLATLDDFEAALKGEKLVGHWRLAKGFDLSKVFTQPRPFDLVSWASGHAAAPYLVDGPTLDSTAWRRWNALLGGGFLGYAIWFN
jgi:hypothetical protein